MDLQQKVGDTSAVDKTEDSSTSKAPNEVIGFFGDSRSQQPQEISMIKSVPDNEHNRSKTDMSLDEINIMKDQSANDAQA